MVEDELELNTVMDSGLTYGENLLGTGNAGSTYRSWPEAVSNILVAGCSNIANEVANTKIGTAHYVNSKDYDPDYIESPYSKKSYQDFKDNVLSHGNERFLTSDDHFLNFLEAVARVNATLRRARGTAAQARPADVLRCRDLELDLDACTLTCAGAPVELTPVELRIMTLLMEHPGRVFTKQQLYEAGWEEDYVAAENSVMVCLSKLRAKLGDDPQAYIRTIRGIGYRLEK